MSELKPTPAQCQNSALQELAQADKCTNAAKKHLELMSPFMKNSAVYEELTKLGRKINEVMSKVSGLSIT